MTHQQRVQAEDTEAIIWTEGKTDWKHLKKASEKLGLKLNISFHQREEDMGGDALLRRCKTFAETLQVVPMVFVFDRDDEAILRQVSDPTTGYKSWGNNVFSFAVPVPAHREGYENVCIELYYSDDDIKQEDLQGRRLFLTSEFNEGSGTHIGDSTIHIGNVHKLKGVTEPKNAKIVDSEVYKVDKSIALSKSDFANHIYSDVAPFDQFSREEFRRIFEIIETIIQVTRPKMSFCLPNLEMLFSDLRSTEPSQQFACIFETLVKILEMTLQLFIVSAIRCYEREIVNEPPEYKKKPRPIKAIVSGRFTNPSLATLSDLARNCYYLVDKNAPDELRRMKECLGQPFTLGPLGDLIDNVERIVSTGGTKSRILNKAGITKRLFDYVVPEIAQYVSKKALLFAEIEDKYGESDGLDIDTWRQALVMLVKHITPLLSQEFTLESLEQVDTAHDVYSMSVRRYADGGVEVVRKAVPFEELDDYGDNTSAIIVTRQGSQVSIGLFPFLVIKDDKLYYYKRTRASGYEYHSTCDSSVHVEPTKRKFNHSVFKTGGTGAQQSLFWTEVLPTFNELNGVRANIPTEGPVEFIGRKKQIGTIEQEVIEIPNQNGIVYGLGGIGKTALMIRTSRELYEEENRKDVLFDNIIWISAKSNYYDPLYNVVQVREPQFRSLNAVVSTILDFFEYRDLDEYGFDDKKELLLELLEGDEEHEGKRVLLVLDNFETIPETEAEAIVRFFEVEVKYRLRRKPHNFKVIITSRKQIPCGFHQIELTGLGLRESKLLMNSLFRQYKDAVPDLSDEQKQELHQATFGIPILIKHCFGQIYRYNRPFDAVVRNLSATPNKAVEFSFEEVLKLLKNDSCQLEIILLLELINCPLLIRQVADILARSEAQVEDKIPSLASFQCVKRINQGRQEKYTINDEIRMLTRRLVQENTELAQEIRQKITENFTIEKQMDYSTEELGILSIFHSYLSENQYLEAERFIQSELDKRPEASLLKFHYAKYLKEQKRDIEGAIEVLEEVTELGTGHPSILQLLVSCYMSLDVPNYDGASVYIRQLESVPLDDESLKLQIAEFYIRWSIFVKMNRDINPDPIEEMLRQQQYKELADKGLTLLKQIGNRTHEVCYLLAQGYFNKWDNENALRMIKKAIKLCKEDPRYYPSYTYLRDLIVRQREKYSGHRTEAYLH